MSESGKVDNARPNTFKDNDARYLLWNYCGGSGSIWSPPEIGIVGVILACRVSKHIVHNKKVIFSNVGIDITNNSAGGYIPQDCYMGLGDTDTMDLESTAKSSGVILNDDLGSSVEFDELLLPQPFLREWEGGGPNPDWSAKIFIYLWWGDIHFCNYVLGFDEIINDNAFKIIKHDNEIKI